MWRWYPALPTGTLTLAPTGWPRRAWPMGEVRAQCAEPDARRGDHVEHQRRCPLEARHQDEQERDAGVDERSGAAATRQLAIRPVRELLPVLVIQPPVQ